MDTATKYLISAGGVLITMLLGLCGTFFWNKMKLQDQAIETLQKEQKELLNKINNSETMTLQSIDRLSKELSAAVLDIKTTIQKGDLDREKHFIRKEDCLLHKEEIEKRFLRLEQKC